MYESVQCDYNTVSGNSGAPIMYGSKLLGIHVGGPTSEEYFCKYSVIRSYLGITYY